MPNRKTHTGWVYVEESKTPTKMSNNAGYQRPADADRTKQVSPGSQDAGYQPGGDQGQSPGEGQSQGGQSAGE